jgi:hypothetical protein
MRITTAAATATAVAANIILAGPLLFAFCIPIIIVVVAAIIALRRRSPLLL